MSKNAPKFRSELVPFDDAIVMVPVRPRPFSTVWTPDQLDAQKRVGKVIAIGPGKIVAGNPTKKLALVSGDPLAAPKPDALRSSAPAEVESIELDSTEFRRYPINVKIGDYVIYSQSMALEPDGPGTRTLLVTRNEFILGKLLGFEEHNEDAAPPNLAVPIPQALVDPTTGRPFVSAPGGAPRA